LLLLQLPVVVVVFIAGVEVVAAGGSSLPLGLARLLFTGDGGDGGLLLRGGTATVVLLLLLVVVVVVVVRRLLLLLGVLFVQGRLEGVEGACVLLIGVARQLLGGDQEGVLLVEGRL
jgi:hypothetical protein